MVRRAALMTLFTALLCFPGVARAQTDATNRPPVITTRMYQTPVLVNNWNEIHLFDSYDPDGWLESGRITVDGHVVHEGEPPWSYPFQYATPGRRVVKIELTDNDGATASKTVNLDVLSKDFFEATRAPKTHHRAPLRSLRAALPADL